MVKPISRIFLALMGVACYLPKMYIFTDTLLLPKWYAFLLAFLLLMLLNAVVTLLENLMGKDVVSLDYAIFAIQLMAVCECVYVITHVLLYGFSIAGERGTFDNPSGLALCTAIPLAFVFGRVNHMKKCVRNCLLILFISTIILTRSRTGIICVSVLVMLQFAKTDRISRYLKCGFISLLILATISYVHLHKQDSTSGRYFILKNSIELICEHPIFGHGCDGFKKAYMLKQADFFNRNPDSKYSMLADEIHHPLNEFVSVWVKFGILGPIVLLSIFVFPVIIGYIDKDKHIISMLPPLLVVFIFCMFSYPLNYPLSWYVIGLGMLMPIKRCTIYAKALEQVHARATSITILAFSCVCITTLLWKGYNEYRWNKAWLHLRKNEDTALNEYAEVAPYLSKDCYFLYNYAFALYSRGQFDESIAVMERCLTHWNGYNLQLLMGDAFRMERKYSEAIPHYDLAHNMCPARLAPLEGMYLAYDGMGDHKNRAHVARMISEQKIKVPSYDAYRIKQNYK